MRAFSRCSPLLGSPRRCCSGSRRRRRRARRRRRGSRSIRCGPSRCRTAGIIGQTIGVWVDAQDHVWIIHRADRWTRPKGGGQTKAPASAARRRRRCSSSIRPAICSATGAASDGAGYQWPASNHGLTIDTRATSGLAATARQRRPHPEVHAGRQVPDAGRHQEGRSRPDSNSQDRFFLVAKIFVDAKTNEVYVADGYGNKRVVVIDGDTGKFKRFWGAYGNKPSDEPAPSR